MMHFSTQKYCLFQVHASVLIIIINNHNYYHSTRTGWVYWYSTCHKQTAEMHARSAYSGPSTKHVLSLSALSFSIYSLLVSRIKSYFLSTLIAQTGGCNISPITSTTTTTNSNYILCNL